MKKPLVSIVIPVYNAQRYLRPAIESMLAQTFYRLEMICINDGSNDSTSEILAEFTARDPRVRVFHQENQGVTATLNRGLSLAQAPLVARMDADDIAMPERLTLQVAFSSRSSTACRSRCAILKIDTDSDRLGVDRLPTNHEEIEAALLERRTGLFHPPCCTDCRCSSRRWLPPGALSCRRP